MTVPKKAITFQKVMLKEQPSPFWNAETFYSQIIPTTIPYIVI